MMSPSKAKDKKKEPAQSKKRQLLNVFHQSLSFLQILTPDELDVLQDKLHVFVFSRGQTLAKEMEPIDYIGVIAEGRAVSKAKNYQIGDLIGHSQVLGFHQKHPQSITGQSEGVIIAIRIYDIVTSLKPNLANKITAHLAQVYAHELLKREQTKKLTNQFQVIDEKKLSKYLTPEWSQFFSDLDVKQKGKFLTYFPFYSLKQKDMILNSGSKGYLLYVVRGQLIAKNKQLSKVIESGHLFYPEGFLSNQSSQDNLYCLSADADVLVVNRDVLQNHFKIQTFRSMLRIALNATKKKFQVDEQLVEVKDSKTTKKVDEWSIFKKHPERQIVPLPKKSVTAKPQKQPNSVGQQGLQVFQTLFRDQLGVSDGKIKTNTSVAESNYAKLYTLKTEPDVKQGYLDGETEKLRKELQILSEKLKFTEEMSKANKLDLIENRSRLAMGKVLREIQKLHIQQDMIHPKAMITEGKSGEGLLTFKQAFQKQVRQSKIQEVVAKCAFRWLYLTRRRKALSHKI